MVAAVTCQNCGAHVDAQYARVFGNEDDEVHACRNYSMQSAIVNGAAVDADRDGTQLVHRPGVDESVPAVFHETESKTHSEDHATIEKLRKQSSDSATDAPTDTHDDEAFAALIAE